MEPRWRFSTRIDREEWLDQGIGAPEAMAESLADLDRINRWLGGTRSLALHLYPRLRRWVPRAVTVLDLGSGGCGVPIALARWARGAGVALRVLALDQQERHLRWAQRRVRDWPEISLVQGDALKPPFARATVDVVISSLFLHHFTQVELVAHLPVWVGIARRSLVMTDLVRHAVPYYFMKASGPLFARSPLTRHDAAVSIQRAYAPQELRATAVEAGFPGAQVFTHFPFRMTLVIDKEGV